MYSYLENTHLVLHEMEEPILQKSIAEARRAGYLQNRKIRVALDTTPILGKGAVTDTYNLLGERIAITALTISISGAGRMALLLAPLAVLLR
jgi:hypothetical protein